MKDLKIVGNRISMKNGDFELVDGEDRVIQHIRAGVKLLLGDWILDYRKGVNLIHGLRAYPDILKAQIKAAIKSVFGVDRLTKYIFEEKDDDYLARGYVLSENKEIPFEGSVGL